MSKILSIGTALPAGLMAQDEACSYASRYSGNDGREKRLLEKLYKRTQIQSRATIFGGTAQATLSDFYPPPCTANGDSDQANESVCDTSTFAQPGTAARMERYSREITPLALAAAVSAVEKAGVHASQISNLVTVSCTGFSAPGFDTELIEQLGLSRSVSRTHVGFMGCHGALNGLRAGSALAADSSLSLVVAAELCSLHFQYAGNNDDRLANALFADGAAAAVLAGENYDCKNNTTTNGAEYFNQVVSPRLVSSASYLLPDSAGAMTWKISDRGFRMTLSPQVPSIIGGHLRSWLDQWLDGHGLDTRQVSTWAVHPGGPRILDAVEETLRLEEGALKQSREVFSHLGNMSSPTILFIVERLLAAGPSALPLVALAFGPGLTIEAALFR